MWIRVVALLLLLFVSPIASAEIFKCVGKYGEDLYQNFPCHFESIGWMPTDAQDAKKSLAAPAQQAGVNVAQGQKQPATLPAEPQIGMTAEEVKAIWGEPTDTVQEEPQIGGRLEVWSYGDSRSVSFNPRGRVVAIKK